jgi:hypothetical protein
MYAAQMTLELTQANPQAGFGSREANISRGSMRA